jgi:hypothetical protein
MDGVGGPVVLAGLPDDRVGVVLAAVVDGDPDSEGEGELGAPRSTIYDRRAQAAGPRTSAADRR